MKKTKKISSWNYATLTESDGVKREKSTAICGHGQDLYQTGKCDKLVKDADVSVSA